MNEDIDAKEKDSVEDNRLDHGSSYPLIVYKTATLEYKYMRMWDLTKTLNTTIDRQYQIK